MRLTDNDYNMMYICHQTGIPLREVAQFTVHEYEMWCAYFARLNGVEKPPEELTEEEVAIENGKNFQHSTLFSMLFKEEDEDVSRN